MFLYYIRLIFLLYITVKIPGVAKSVLVSLLKFYWFLKNKHDTIKTIKAYRFAGTSTSSKTQGLSDVLNVPIFPNSLINVLKVLNLSFKNFPVWFSVIGSAIISGIAERPEIPWVADSLISFSYITTAATHGTGGRAGPSGGPGTVVDLITEDPTGKIQ